MLVDILLVCAPVAAALPAVVGALTSHNSYAGASRLQRRLYRSLLLTEKLPPDAVGARQIGRDVDRQTLQVAYVAQYPERARELLHVGLIGAGVLAAAAAYVAVLVAGGWWGWLAVLLGMEAVAALWFERALGNFTRNDGTVRALFGRFAAPDALVRPRTELLAHAPGLGVDDVLARAADVRDAQHGGALTTLAAVNLVLAQAHTHDAWKREVRALADRVAGVDYGGYGRRSYDVAVDRVVRPLFAWRLEFLDDRERRRVQAAHRAGDVYKAAWLAAHYRNERRRLAGHWARIRTAHLAPHRG